MSDRTDTHTRPRRSGAPSAPPSTRVRTSAPRVDRGRRPASRGSLSIEPPKTRTVRPRVAKPVLEIPERLQLERLLVRDTIPAPVDRFAECFTLTGLMSTVAPVGVAAALVAQLGRAVFWYELVLLLTATVSLRLFALINGDSREAERRSGDGPEALASARAARTAILVAVSALLPLWLEHGPWSVVYALSFTSAGAAFFSPLVPKRWQRIAMPLMQTLLPAVVVCGAVLALNGGLGLGAVILALQLAFARALIAAVEGLRDLRVDLKRGRVTWMTLLGPERGREVLAVISVAPVAAGGLWLATGAWWLAIAAVLATPPLFRLVPKVFTHEPGPIYNLLYRPAIAFNIVLVAFNCVGLLVL